MLSLGACCPTFRCSGRLRRPLSLDVMQQANPTSIARLVSGLRGGLAEQAALEPAAKSGGRAAVSGVACAERRGLRSAVVAASPASLLASAFSGLPLRQRVAASVTVPSSSGARHNRSLEPIRVGKPPLSAQLSR